jgi:hypothetical protein
MDQCRNQDGEIQQQIRGGGTQQLTRWEKTATNKMEKHSSKQNGRIQNET